MGKRTKTQLTREQVYSGDVEALSGDEMPLKPKIASKEKMARRKIAHFKSRLHTGFGAPGVNPLSSNKIDAAAHPAHPSSAKSAITEATQLKSLNANFLKAVNDSLQVNPVADLYPILQKYTDYYKKVENGELEVKNPSLLKVDVKPIANNESSVFKFGDFTKKNDKPTKSETTLKPQVNNAIDQDNDVSLSDEAEEVKKETVSGPKFTLNALPTSKDYGFKFGSVPKKSGESDDEESKSKGPTFKITPELSKPDPNAVFKFAAAPKKKEEEEEKKVEPVSHVSSLPSKPAFSFSHTENPQSAEKLEKSTAPPTTPGFSFAKPSSTFGNNVNNKNADEQPKKSEESGTKSSFTFGGNTSTSNESGFSGFKFGTGNSLASSADSAKPSSGSAFKFSVPSADSSKPSTGFTFGSAPANTNSNPFGGSNSSSFGFSFTAPSGESKAPADAADVKKQDEDNVKGNFAVVKMTEKVDVKTGEEDENAIFTKRTKLSKFNPENKEKPYETVGVGELKVLVNEKTKKSRILVRSDGNGNILLNVSILKDLTFSLIGPKKNILRIPAVTSGGKMEIYIAQVKTGEDGSTLLKKVQDCQK